MRSHRKVNSVGRHGCSLFTSSIRSLGVISVLLGVAIGQNGDEIGVDLCGCAPGSYEFTFDFSLTCPPIMIERDDAIADTFCTIAPFGDINETITDLVPVEIYFVDILELVENFEIVSQTNITGDFKSGDSFSYNSIVTDQDAAIIPKVLQVNIFGLNAQKQRITNFYAIGFSNKCDADYPVIEPGDSAGWTSFTSVTAPPRNVCPAVPLIPTASPTGAPTASPVTETPTASPVTGTPSAIPTGAPTAIPVTGTPTVTSPTPAPTINPVTPAPTLSPVSPAPSGFSMSMDFDMDTFDDLIEEFGRSSSDFDPPSFKSPKMVPKTKEGKRSKSVKSGKKSGKKAPKVDLSSVKSTKSAKADQVSVKTPKAESAKSAKAEQVSVKSLKAESAKSAKAEQGSKKSSKAESAKSVKAENDVKSAKAEAAQKGRRRQLRLTHRVD